MTTPTTARYIGRLAPSPTGLLHLGHARTFWIAASRARAAGGRLLLRNDDLDRARCRPEFVAAMIEDLRWLLGDDAWEEPMISQSERLPLYREALARLHAARLIFPCHRSRRDVSEAIGAPHEGAHDEPLYPREWRPPADAPLPPLDTQGLETNWRFRVPDPDGNADNDARISFVDGHAGPQQAVAGRDFGDFLVWRKDGLPSYQLACAVDDLALGVTEVVRGADLIRSTFRQLLLMRVLVPRDTSPPPPSPALPHYYHCPLMTDETGQRLAKRHDALALRTLRADGTMPDELRRRYFDE